MMAKSETLTIDLPEKLARAVHRAVDRGDYLDPADVVSAALLEWVDRGSPPAMSVQRLRELVDEAETSGEADEEFDVEALLAHAHASRPGQT